MKIKLGKQKKRKRKKEEVKVYVLRDAGEYMVHSQHIRIE